MSRGFLIYYIMIHILTLPNDSEIRLTVDPANGSVLLSSTDNQVTSFVELDKVNIHDLIGLLTFCKNRL